jgi:dihydroflavonol-4-reductase
VILVTGATGYVGSAVVAALIARRHPVRAGVRDPARAAVVPAGAERVPLDLDDRESVRSAVRGCDGVVHCAVVVRPTPADTARANTALVGRLLTEVAGRRFVYTSTPAAVLTAGGVASERAEPGTALDDVYLRHKADAEKLLLDSGQDTVVVSPASVYGPSPAGPLSYNELLEAAADGTVTAIADARIGWVLAEDVAVGHALAYESGTAGRRYILCGAVASFPEVLNRYCELVGSPHRVVPGEQPDAPFLARRASLFATLPPQRIDDAQARGLGFGPAGIEEGLRRTARWISSARRRR